MSVSIVATKLFEHHPEVPRSAPALTIDVLPSGHMQVGTAGHPASKALFSFTYQPAFVACDATFMPEPRSTPHPVYLLNKPFTSFEEVAFDWNGTTYLLDYHDEDDAELYRVSLCKDGETTSYPLALLRDLTFEIEHQIKAHGYARGLRKAD